MIVQIQLGSMPLLTFFIYAVILIWYLRFLEGLANVIDPPEHMQHDDVEDLSALDPRNVPFPTRNLYFGIPSFILGVCHSLTNVLETGYYPSILVYPYSFSKVLLACLGDIILSNFIATGSNVRNRVFQAALTPLQNGMPKGWVEKRDLLGRAYYFDKLTCTWSWEKPTARALFDPLTDDTRAGNNRIAVLVPNHDANAVLECLLLTYDLVFAVEYMQSLEWLSRQIKRYFGLKLATAFETAFSRQDCGWADCLSYCWGNPDITEDILVNGHRLPVTVNLAAALRELRSQARDLPKMLWVDAICINQSNKREKSKVVPLMQYLYQSADVIQLWLGADESIEPAIRYFNRMRLSDRDSRAGHAEVTSGSAVPLSDREANPEISDEVALSLQELWMSPVWTRKWILQELCLAHKIILRAGREQTSPLKYEDFTKICQLQPSAEMTRATAPMADGIALHGMNSLYKIYRMKSQSKTRIPSIISTLRSLRATVDADHVLGLLSLCQDMIDCPPDFRKPFESVFKTFTKELIHFTGNLRLIEQGSFRSTALPSWVPDYRVPVRSFFGRAEDLAPFEIAGADKSGQDAVSAFFQPVFSFPNDHTLLAPMLILDTIKAVACSRPTATSGPNHTSLTDTVDWVDFCDSEMGQDGINSLLVFLQSLADFQLNNLDLELGATTNWRTVLSSTLDSRNFELLTHNQRMETLRTACSALTLSEPVRLFATSKGRLGFSSSGTKVETGDKIVAIQSCRWLFVVESRDQPEPDVGKMPIVSLRGKCYVDGIEPEEVAIAESLKRFGNEESVGQVFESVHII